MNGKLYINKDKEFEDMCRKGLKKALKNKDGYLAHFYGRMFLPSFVLSPRPNRCAQKWID